MLLLAGRGHFIKCFKCSLVFLLFSNLTSFQEDVRLWINNWAWQPDVLQCLLQVPLLITYYKFVLFCFAIWSWHGLDIRIDTFGQVGLVSSWWVGSGLGVDVKQAMTKYSFGSERKYTQSMEYGAPSLIQHSYMSSLSPHLGLAGPPHLVFHHFSENRMFSWSRLWLHGMDCSHAFTDSLWYLGFNV